MAKFQVYHSGDTSAPSLSGTSGALITVLDACLVNGYGTKPGAGWTKPFADSASVAAYRQATGSMLYLSVRDSDAGLFHTAVSAEAQFTGYETMSTVDVGTGAFPTASQGPGASISSSYLVIRKSKEISTTDRPWTIFADSSSFYAFVSTGDTANIYYGFAFGDIYSVHTGSDAYKCMIVGRNIQSSSAVANEGLSLLTAISTVTPGHFIARSWNQLGTSITCSVSGDATKGSSTALFGNIAEINSVNGGLYISPVYICEILQQGPTANIIRGKMRGFYQLLHPVTNYVDRQIFSGSGDSVGKTFEIVKSACNAGLYFIETSDTLDTN